MPTSTDTFRYLVAASVVAAASGLAVAQTAVRPDIPAPDVRRPTIELAERIARQAEAQKLPADLKSPFSPPDFDQPTAGESSPARPGQPTGSAVAAGPRPTGARAILDQASAALRTSGIGIIRRGTGDILSLRESNGNSRLIRVGDSINVTIEGTPHTIQVAAIDAAGSSYTLTYQGERLTLSTSARTPAAK